MSVRTYSDIQKPTPYTIRKPVSNLVPSMTVLLTIQSVSTSVVFSSYKFVISWTLVTFSLSYIATCEVRWTGWRSMPWRVAYHGLTSEVLLINWFEKFLIKLVFTSLSIFIDIEPLRLNSSCHLLSQEFYLELFAVSNFCFMINGEKKWDRRK